MYYRGCWHIVSRCLFEWYRQVNIISYAYGSSQTKEFYNPKAVIIHAVLLHQAFAHCEKFPTAASRRSMDRVSVPLWLFNLSVQLCIVALVSLYLTNKLMHRIPIL